MICERHGAMLCFGNALFDFPDGTKEMRIYRCVLAVCKKDDNSGKLKTWKELVNRPMYYGEYTACQKLIEEEKGVKK